MRKTTLACLLVVLAAAQAGAYSHWNEIRHSALLPGDSVLVRVENSSAPGALNRILFASGGVQEAGMAQVQDGPATLEAIAPGPVASARYYGFRYELGAEIELMPVRIADGVTPTPADLSRLAEDPAGDELFGYPNLDLIDCRIGFSGVRLYAALTNVGGGFPVSSGLTFFGYLLGIADPALAEPDTVIAMMHTYTLSGTISPGLYLVTGTGLSNLTKIGEVVVTEFPEINTLMISCDLADLMSNAYFLSWFDPDDPRIGVGGFTQRISLLSGVQEADRTPGGRVHLREFSIAPAANTLPVLSNLAVVGSGAEALARVEYQDAEGHCPVLAELAIDGVPYPMYPAALDYRAPVVYETEAGIEPLASGSWTSAVARFSDNGVDVVELELSTTDASHGQGPDSPAAPRLLIAPNPFNATATIEYFMPAGGRMRLEIFDARGGLVRTLSDGPAPAGRGRLVWDGRNDGGRSLASGLFICRLTAPGGVSSEKLLLIR